MSNMVTRIIDNLQVTLRNIHIRIENQDTIEENRSFSLGVTLQAADLFTTDSSWNKSYIDRSEVKNKDKPVSKLLSIENFGIYYKIKETKYVQS
jgi:vacuolar protein sorting-associated protein 13A/C